MADVNEKMRDALVAYRYVQRKMLEKWSEGDERVKAGLWAALHKCEALADAALAEQPAQGDCNHCGGFGDVLGESPGCACPMCYGTGKVAAPPAPSVQPAQGEAVERCIECGVNLYTAPSTPSVSVPDEMWAGPPHSVDYVNGWNACRDAMLASGGKASVPEGWKLVPVEPTIEMRVAYNVACETESGEDESWLVNAGYTAMLVAATKVKP